MSRGFNGARGGSGGSGGTKRRSAKDMFMAQMRGEDIYGGMSDDERYKKIFEEKLEELRTKAKGSRKSSVVLPGTDPGAVRELSATAQKVIDDMLNKRAKKFASERSRTVRVKPKVFTGVQGGRIDKNGNIFGPDNRWIASVDKKTGKIRSRRGGITVCTYNPNSSVCEFRITQFIANEYRTKKGNLYGSRGHSGIGYGIYGQAGAGLDGSGSIYSQVGSGFWSQNTDGSEGIHGASGNDHSLWGWQNTSSDDNKGGFWG
ncbi:MAG: hypothetical protein K2Q12_06710 [Rickettsiales bacterium]|nr:hypothetical protein [Rickettsiales bacterium]